jgi:hypothetical protein
MPPTLKLQRNKLHSQTKAAAFTALKFMRDKATILSSIIPIMKAEINDVKAAKVSHTYIHQREAL